MNVDKENAIKVWLQYSKDDLYASEHFLKQMEFPFYRVVCFHAQQAAEKYLKAYQIYFDLDVIKTHSLNALISSLQNFDNDILALEENASILSSYAVKYRYPDDFIDLTKANAEESIQIAKQIQQYVTNKITFE